VIKISPLIEILQGAEGQRGVLLMLAVPEAPMIPGKVPPVLGVGPRSRHLHLEHHLRDLTVVGFDDFLGQADLIRVSRGDGVEVC
jgi:hypothetical protein